MNPTKILTTDYKNSIRLEFFSKNRADTQFSGVRLKCKIIYNDLQQIVINGDNWWTCTIPASMSRSHSQNLTVVPTFDGMHSLADQSNYTLTIISPSPQPLQDMSFISEDGLNIVIYFERSVDVSDSKQMHEREYCHYLFTNQTISQLKIYGLVYCKWLTKIQLFISLSLPIDEKSLKVFFNRNAIKESGQEINLFNTTEVTVNKQNMNDLSYETRIELTGPTLMPLCGTFTLNGYFSSAKGSKGVRFKWSISTLPARNDLISDELFKIINSNNKSSIMLEANSFSLKPYSYKFVLSAQLADGSFIEASHQIFKFNDQLPIVTIFSTTLLASGPLTLDQRYFL